VIKEIVAPEGQTVPVGALLAVIEEAGASEAPVSPGKAAEAATPARPLPAGLKVTPAARRRAAELAVALDAIPPAPDGVIGLRDVEEAARRQRPRPSGPDLGEMRKAIAAAMARSNREIPHYWVSHRINMTPFMAWLEKENEARPVERRLLYLAPLLKAMALALQKTPELNGSFQDGGFQPADRFNIGVATALRGGGLAAPAILDVDRLSVDELMERLRDLVARVRTGRLRSSEITDATVTLSSLGEGAVEAITPRIYPPQVAIIGCGAVLDRPWAEHGEVVVRKVMSFTLAGDHRVSDGRRGARFLNRLETLLQEPAAL
jgi:pyruvate dehydrogenase E2 component (dihydrolipoamide acetyltransferase)